MPPHPSQSAPDDPGQPAGNTHAHRQALNDLITMGTDLARLLHAQASAQAAAGAAQPAAAPAQADATPQPAPAPAPDALIHIAAAFDRIARAVRRGVTLARSLDQPVQPALDPARHRTAARKRIIREVEDRIGRTTEIDGWDTTGDAADLHAELRDRLDAPDLDWDLATRPVADIITEICRDLGLAASQGTSPWKRRTPQDIQDLNTRAAAPGAARQPDPERASPRPSATQCPSGPQSDGPASSLRPKQGPTHASTIPHQDAAAIATIPRHPTHSRWRTPPSG